MEVHHFHRILLCCMYNIIGDQQGHVFWSLEINTSIYKDLWVYLPYVFSTSVKVFKLKFKVWYKKYSFPCIVIRDSVLVAKHDAFV